MILNFQLVGFAYDSGETVLKDVSFTAKQGEVTALIGTFRWWKDNGIQTGIQILGRTERTDYSWRYGYTECGPETLMSLYSIVFQDVTLFIIRLWKISESADRMQPMKKLLQLQSWHIVMSSQKKMPNGWNTMIGENGSELSGGERQRISIARAFLKDAPIILLDEATASLDVDNETVIQESLSKLIRNKTVMIIAHRMRTVAEADKIVVLKDGVVAEIGMPKELEEKGGIYQHMAAVQMQAAGWQL